VEISYGGVLAVLAIAVLAPVLASLVPALRLPAVALEIVLGVLVGPAVLGWVEMDVTLDVLGTIGLGYLLFLAGLEIDLDLLRGHVVHILAAWAVTCVLALALAVGFHLIDLHDSTRLIAIALTATSLGLVAPIIREAGLTSTDFGQFVLGAGSVAEFGSLLLLTLFFVQDGSSTESQFVLLVAFCAMAALIALALARVVKVPSVWGTLDRLADTSSQLAVRAVLVVLFVFLALSASLGLEAILGAFVAGALLRYLDREDHLASPSLKPKIEAIGYGFLVPIFFVTSGIQVDVDALFDSPGHLVLVPLLLMGMLVARGLPAILYRSLYGGRRAAGAGLLQATNLSLVVIIASLGTQTGALDPASAAALVGAGVLSVVVFPPLAVSVLPRAVELEADWDESPADPTR
jgi:Kef-type K+ transport system membrane component KefB